MKAFYTVLLLFISNSFMTLAWYGHLKFKDWTGTSFQHLIPVVLISWMIALPEYMAQVPANRLGFSGNGGPFSLVQLKVLQEVITLVVFILFSMIFFKNQELKLNHLIGFLLLILAVYFIFKS